MTTESKPPGQAAGPESRPELDDAPPLLGSWRNIYLLVLGTLALLVALFRALTWAYS
ncbi:MAG TPA: hypothetical protein VNA24_10785 [Hyalangium sp.]|nr:hypothetical protein [Hyalangium sp.]